MLRTLTIFLTIIVSVTMSPAYALRSTRIEGYTDLDFVGFMPRKIVLCVIGADIDMRLRIEQRMTKSLSGFAVVVVTERSLFPPTREWSADARTGIMAGQKIDSSLTIAIGASSAQSIPFAQQTFGSASTLGRLNENGSFSAGTQGQSTTYNLLLVKSSAEFSAVLVDAVSAKTVWFGDGVTKAGGRLFVGAKGDGKAVVNGVVEGLLDDRHLRAKAGR